MKMAESLNDAVSWLLPPQSLSDDFVLVDKENAYTPVAVEKKHALKSMNLNLSLDPNPSLVFPTEFPFDFDSLDSALSSPVDSVVGSTETETTVSDEEDFLAGLTQRLTRKLEKSWGSPESTLNGLGSMSVSSNGSPNSSSSLVSSPPTTPFGGQNDTWDLISAAAGQIARLKMSNSSEAAPTYTTNVSVRATGLLAPPKSSNPVHVIKTPYFGFYSIENVNFDLAANTTQVQYQHYVKQEQMLKAQSQRLQQIQPKARNFGHVNGRCGQQQPQSAWPPLQAQQHQQKPQQQRPVFVPGSGCVRRGCAGTGVFLPRRYGNINNPYDSRKKSGSPNGFVPTTTTPAMNFHAQQRFNCSFGPNYVADAIIARRNALITLQKRGLRQEAARNHEIHLPKEWTY
ncbi:hypothetical protein CISIN_1g015817mg [Citrus sinensis]|uniref:Uncharacterized protein n=1 Tax=Citrus sinensis TaxID=2711 RepID=A0A067G1A6_CITSI|nr:hypothetical protein CISIN_1g015817mg [Citrus sinensis]